MKLQFAQRVVVVGWAILVILTSFYAPTYSPASGRSTAWSHLFSIPAEFWAVDPGRLLAYWGIVTGVATIAFVLVSGNKKVGEP